MSIKTVQEESVAKTDNYDNLGRGFGRMPIQNNIQNDDINIEKPNSVRRENDRRIYDVHTPYEKDKEKPTDELNLNL